MLPGPTLVEGMEYSVMSPVLGDILPILLPLVSVNQRSPSGPEVIVPGFAFVVGIAYSVTLPVVGEILPIKFPEVPVDSEKIVNQRLPQVR